MSRILGVDLGTKRTGLAVCDELRLTTRALETRTPQSRAKDIEYLLALCEELEIKTLLIGYPLLTKTGEEGFMAKRARGFFEAIQQAKPSDINIFLVDESYSSSEAALRTGRTSNLDGESARILIENFIHAQNN